MKFPALHAPPSEGRALGRALPWLLLAASGCGGSAEPTAAEAGPRSETHGLAAPDPDAFDPAADPRIGWLLAPCPRSDPFTADTSDMIPVLVAKLEHGQRDPLRRAKIELGAAGEEAIGALSRFIDRFYADPHRTALLENALDPLARMETPAARPLILRCLDHPVPGVRNAAVRALRGHAREEDYDRLANLLPACRTTLEQSDVTQVMLRADTARMAADLARWLDGGEHPDLWPAVARALCSADRFGAWSDVAPLTEHWEDAPFDVRAFLAGAIVGAAGEALPPDGSPEDLPQDPVQDLAGTGAAAEALAWLLVELEDESSVRRSYAVGALVALGRPLALVAVLARDVETSLRVIAATALASAPPSPERRKWLIHGLADVREEVRLACLAGLVASGDRAGVDYAVTALKDGGPRELSGAMRALRERMPEDAELARRVLELLIERHAAVADRPLAERAALLEAMGLVPLRAAAEELVRLARLEREPISRMSAHRWLVRQAGNTGDAGRVYLAQCWAEEPSLARRLDLAEAIAFDVGPRTQRFLVGVFDAPHTDPYERLYAAERLVSRGPAAEVAPFLKRRALAVEHAAVARALRCLLWKWYG